jgi:hypothetical protein
MGGDRKVIHAPRRDITKDPREDEEWFQRLPPDVQDETRESWRARRVRFDPWHERNRSMRTRCLIEGVCVCMFPTVLMVQTTWMVILIAIPGGLLTGYLWWRLGTGRLWSGLVAMAVLLLVVLLAGKSIFSPTWFFNAAFGMFAAGMLGSGLGQRREIHRREQAL